MEEFNGVIQTGGIGLINYRIKVSEQPSELHGLNGSRVIKLEITKDDTPVFIYNRGYVKGPDDFRIVLAVASLIKKYQ